eukprot:g886.t1
MNDGDIFGGDDGSSSAGEEGWSGKDLQAEASTVLAAAGGQVQEAQAAEAKGGLPSPAPAPTTPLARQESAEAGRALVVCAVSGDEESESKGEGAAGAAAGGSWAGPRKTAPVDDRVRLRGIYEALGGPEHWHRKWDLDRPINTLHRVTCDERGRVVKIDLSENGLRGDLSKVRFPASLQTLNLSGGYLRPMSITGDLSEVQFPASLQTLNLSCAYADAMNITASRHRGYAVSAFL